MQLRALNTVGRHTIDRGNRDVFFSLLFCPKNPELVRLMNCIR